MAKDVRTKFNEVLCIGLGMSGVCLGVQLKRKFGFSDIHFYDRNSAHSGTWEANRYPGCACDVSAIYYSFSFAINPNWTRLFPSNLEICEYIEGVVEQYQLRPHLTFQTECESATWDSDRQVWTVQLRDLVTGEKHTHECRLLFSAVGVLVEPKYPEIPGRETFEGPIFHTAKWRSDVDLKGKHVSILGNGCSATQLVPEITPMTKTLTQFIHTPHWLVERSNMKFGPKLRWAFRNVPLFTRFIRLLMFLGLEKDWRLFTLNKTGTRLRRAGEKASKEFILRMAPEKYHETLIPDWEFACKRRVFDNDALYLKSLHAPNFNLTKDPIVEILPRGVRTATKTYPSDVIILGTGFETNSSLGSMRIQGRNGQWLDDHWKEMGGPSAYNNTAVHGFPNFLILYGPNSSTGHNSVLFSIQCLVDHALKIVGPIIKGEASEVEIQSEAEKRYTERVQGASVNKIWNTCKNWYVTNGRNATMYPWSQIYFWWRATFPVWSDWNYKYTPRHERRLRLRKAVLLVLFTCGIIGATMSLGVSYNGFWSSFVKFASDLKDEVKKRIIPL